MISDDDDKVEVLPLMGEPLTIKTAKQGRRSTISKMVDLKDYIRGPDGEIKKREDRQLNLKELRLTLANIIKHPKVTDPQKTFALELLDREILTPANVTWIRNTQKILIRKEK